MLWYALMSYNLSAISLSVVDHTQDVSTLWSQKRQSMAHEFSSVTKLPLLPISQLTFNQVLQHRRSPVLCFFCVMLSLVILPPKPLVLHEQSGTSPRAVHTFLCSRLGRKQLLIASLILPWGCWHGSMKNS